MENSRHFETYKSIKLNCKLQGHNNYQYISATSNTRCANSCIRRQLFSTLDSGYQQAMIQECERTQKLKTISWKSPHFTFKKYVKNVCNRQWQNRLKEGHNDVQNQ